LNEAIVSEDIEKIEEALERLKNSSLEIGKAIYSQGNADEGDNNNEGEQQQDEQKDEEPKAEEAEQTEGEKKEEEKK